MFRSTSSTKTDTPITHHALRACLDGRHEARGHTETARAPEGARGIQRAHPSHRAAYGAGLQRQRQLIARHRVVGQVQQASCAGPSGTKVSHYQVCGEVQNAPDRGWRRTVDSISASSCTIAVRCSTLPPAPREALICGASTRRVARRWTMRAPSRRSRRWAWAECSCDAAQAEMHSLAVTSDDNAPPR